MKIIACGSVPTIIASNAYFTGRVTQNPIIETEAPARLRATSVSFEPGARTHWHTHPLGQTLYVVSGAGLVQSSGGPIREIRAMTHIAMQEALNGSPVDWLEPVSDEQYGG